MKKGIIGKKIGMTQIFDEKGNVVPVTVIEATPNVVAQVKTVETDGYNSIQLGYGEVKDKHINKPEKGHFTKAGLAAKKHLREFRVEDVENYKVGMSYHFQGYSHCESCIQRKTKDCLSHPDQLS